MSYVNTRKRETESAAKREINPVIVYAVLGILAVFLLGYAGFYFLTPAPPIPHPATVQEPTG